MAPKRPFRPEDAPAPPSSEELNEEEEESSSSSEESEEEEEGGEKNLAATPPPPPPPVDKKAPPSNPVAPSPMKSTPESSSDDEDEEDGSESESESDSPPKNRRSSRAADPTIKPIATKPMEETPKAKKARSRPGVSVTLSPVKPSSVKPSNAKRASETGTERKESKKAKKKEPELDPEAEAEAEEEDDGKRIVDESKKQLFQRIWSAEDEIGILKGMMDFSAKHGSFPYPSGDMNEFYDFVNSSLHGDFSRAQLSDKVRRLRKKYINNLARAKLGEDPTFQKPHEQKAFELSKKIWGGEGNSVGVQQNNRANGKPRKTLRANKVVDDHKAVNGNVAETVTTLSEEPKLETEPQREPLRSHPLILGDFTQKNETLGLRSTLHRSIEIGLGLLPEPMKSELKEKQKELEDEEFQLYTKKLELMLMQVRAAMQAYRAHHQ